MTIIDNKSLTLYDDLQKTIHKNSKISIAAGCFSMYAYQALKKQLDHIDSLRFIFTSPTFVSEKTPKEKREFYIPRLSRERNLYGTEFEIRLRNELNQRAIARECADWIRKKVQFRSNVTQQYMPQFMTVDDTAYNSIQNFTAADLGCEKSNSAYTIITKTTDYSASRQFLEIFDQIWSDKQKMQDVTDIIAENIAAVYQENSPEFIYFYTLYNIFSEFLEDISEDVLPNEATGFRSSAIWGKLYNFQKDAALAIINKLEKYNGCILADSVGLGKRLPRWLLSNTTKPAINPFSCSVQKSWKTTGIPIKEIIKTIPSPATGCGTMYFFIPISPAPTASPMVSIWAVSTGATMISSSLTKATISATAAC